MVSGVAPGFLASQVVVLILARFILNLLVYQNFLRGPSLVQGTNLSVASLIPCCRISTASSDFWMLHGRGGNLIYWRCWCILFQSALIQTRDGVKCFVDVLPGAGWEVVRAMAFCFCIPALNHLVTVASVEFEVDDGFL